MYFKNLTQKKELLDTFRPLPHALVTNLEEWFRIELTYTSNAIEGNTLTRNETALVVEKGLTVGGKSIKEHLEATNHAQALDWVMSVIERPPHSLTQSDIIHIHEVILKGIDDDNAGRYRTVPVRISGSMVILPNPRKVPDKMHNFIQWLQSVNTLHPVEFAARAHYELVTIHPFVDGNGRTARLLMNLILMMFGYPPAIIRKRDRLAYLQSLERAQLGGALDGYLKLMGQSVNRSLDIYLKAVQGESDSEDQDSDVLLKIGDLAKATGETVPTMRHWTQAGLLIVSETTPSGYQLYSQDMVSRCNTIKALKTERWSLAEIKKKLSKAES